MALPAIVPPVPCTMRSRNRSAFVSTTSSPASAVRVRRPRRRARVRVRVRHVAGAGVGSSSVTSASVGPREAADRRAMRAPEHDDRSVRACITHLACATEPPLRALRSPPPRRARMTSEGIHCTFLHLLGGRRGRPWPPPRPEDPTRAPKTRADNGWSAWPNTKPRSSAPSDAGTTPRARTGTHRCASGLRAVAARGLGDLLPALTLLTCNRRVDAALLVRELAGELPVAGEPVRGRVRRPRRRRRPHSPARPRGAQSRKRQLSASASMSANAAAMPTSRSTPRPRLRRPGVSMTTSPAGDHHQVAGRRRVAATGVLVAHRCRSRADARRAMR